MKKKSIISIPYAGGNRYSFVNFRAFFPSTLNFVTLELPGRGARLDEGLLNELPSMVNDLYTQIKPFLNHDYVIYGHSMGGMLGNLLIQKLNEYGEKMPLHFFVTGCRSPINNHSRKIFHSLSDDEFWQELQTLGGLPADILHNNALMDFFLPIIRADFKSVETYKYKKGVKYNVDITAITGLEDSIGEKDLKEWSNETSAELRTFCLPGGHFFINDHSKEIAKLIKDVMED